MAQIYHKLLNQMQVKLAQKSVDVTQLSGKTSICSKLKILIREVFCSQMGRLRFFSK